MDLSSSISIETITHLKHEWHKAAIDGDTEACTSFQGPLDCLLTLNRNTLLHLHLARPNSTSPRRTNQRSTEFVQQILNKCPSLLKKPNAKGEIPLHVAARFGHSNIVQLLIKTAEAGEKDIENGIDPAKKMLRMMDNEGDTAMHKAVRYGRVDVVSELLRADPEFSYSVNCSHETPLYIAARRGHASLVAMILDKSDAADHQGPSGRTALHAAVMADPGLSYSVNRILEIPQYFATRKGYSRLVARVLYAFIAKVADHQALFARTALPEAAMNAIQWHFAGEFTTREILKKRKDLVKARDENGRTPLHYAAHLGFTVIVRLLLECDASAAYEIDEDKMTALHMAARQGHSSVMSEIIDYCPECCEVVDKRGWNFLHFAAVSLPFPSLYILFKDGRFRRFAHEKDIHGNTPVQVSLVSRPRGNEIAFDYDDRGTIQLENLDSKKRGKIIELVKEVSNGEVAGLPFNNVHHQVYDEHNFDKGRETHAVVAALIATVAFAAAFTLPGGYKSDASDQDRGSAILSHDLAFGAFVIADSVAMISALISISFNYMSANPPSFAARERYKFLLFRFMVYSGFLAQVALLVAFVTGLIAVLKPALTLAITTAIIVLFVFVAHFLLSSTLYGLSV